MVCTELTGARLTCKITPPAWILALARLGTDVINAKKTLSESFGGCGGALEINEVAGRCRIGLSCEVEMGTMFLAVVNQRRFIS